MDGTLIYSQRTYSIAKHTSVIKWHEDMYHIDTIRCPHDFEVRLVKVATSGKSIYDEFKHDFDINWSINNDIRSYAKKKIPFGLVDIAFYITSLNIGIVIDSHSSIPKIDEYSSIDALKKALI